VGVVVHLGLGPDHPIPAAALILPTYGAVYFLATSRAAIPEARQALALAKRLSGLYGA